MEYSIMQGVRGDLRRGQGYESTLCNDESKLAIGFFYLLGDSVNSGNSEGLSIVRGIEPQEHGTSPLNPDIR